MKYIATILFVFISCCLALGDIDEKALVQTTYQTYRNALLQNNGKSAWKSIDLRTKDYYNDIVRDCLSLKRADLDRLDLLSKIMILRIRLEYREDELKTFDGESIFVIAIQKGWVSKSTAQSINKMEIIKIEQNMAKGYLKQAPDFPLFHFVKETDGWKLALWKSFEYGNMALKETIKNKGMSEDEFLAIILSQISKYKVDERVFDGPLK